MEKKQFFLLFIFIFEIIRIPLSHGNENQFREGVELFNTGQFQKSYDLLLKAFEAEPENLDLNFYIGRAAFETGNFEMAVMAFERILISSPHENRVKLEIARAFQKLGANSTALQYCEEVLATHPPEAVRNNINAFIAYIKKTEQKHFFNGQIASGVDWNNNIWTSPTVRTINTILGSLDLTGSSSQKTSDWIYNTTLAFQHAYHLPLSGYLWKTDLTFYNAVYDQTSPLDIRYFGGSTGPDIVSGKNKFGIRLLGNRIDLGNTHYQDSLGLKLSLEHTVNPDLLYRTSLKFEEKDFKDITGKDAENLSLAAGMNYLFKNNWIDIGLNAEKENADNAENSYNRYGSRISVSRTLPFGTTGSAAYAYQFSKYSEPGSLFDKSREDHQHSVGTGFSKLLWQSALNPDQNASLNLNYQHVWAFSNIGLYEYEQDLFQLFIIYAF